MSKQNSTIDWVAVRAQFPAAERYVYLNTGAGGCMSVRAAEAAKKYYDDSVEHADIRYSEWGDEVEAVRQALADSWSADVDEIGFAGSLSMAMNAAALMFREQGGEVVTMADEFPSVTLPWLNRGYTVRYAPSTLDGHISLERIAAKTTMYTRYVVTSSVQYKTGFRQDLEALGQWCKERDYLLIVDATQSFGAFPIDVQACNIAFLAASTYKWTTAGYGVAPFYVRRDLLEKYRLPFVGYRSNVGPDMMVNDPREFARTAKSIESGHLPIASILAMGGAMRLFGEVGEAAITKRILALTGYLQQQLDAAGLRSFSPREADYQSGITIVGVGTRDNAEVAAALRDANVYVSPRGAGLRVAVHLYNNEADVDAFMAALRAIL